MQYQIYGANGPIILGITWATGGLTTVLMIIRAIKAARIEGRSLRWDFIWALLAFVLGIGGQVLLTCAVLFGIGNHMDDLPAKSLVRGLFFIWQYFVVALWSNFFGKVAWIALFLFIQDTTHPRGRIVLHGLWILNFVLFANQTVLIFLQCRPTAKLWDDSIPGSCAFSNVTFHVGFLQGSLTSATDLILGLYPVYIFHDLQLSRISKVQLCLLMSGGIFTCAAGIAKTIYIGVLLHVTDVTLQMTPLVIWSQFEIWAIIVFGSLPAVKNVFKRAFHHVRHATQRSQSAVSTSDTWNRSTTVGTRSSKITGQAFQMRPIGPGHSYHAKAGRMTPKDARGSEEIIFPNQIKVTTQFDLEEDTRDQSNNERDDFDHDDVVDSSVMDNQYLRGARS